MPNLFNPSVTNAQAIAAEQLRNRDSYILRRTVPPYLMWLGVQELRKRGETLRADVVDALDKASVAPLSGLDDLTISRLAKRTDEIATSTMREVAPDNPHDAILGAAYFILRLVNEGYIEDVGNQGVLVAMTLIEEAKDDQEGWNFNEKRVVTVADKMMWRCSMWNLFKGGNVPQGPLTIK